MTFLERSGILLKELQSIAFLVLPELMEQQSVLL